ncbi:indolepyruvate ferredoxin oxidoreductase family protein [Pseudonocardia sp. RS010]|uniref:indolepyruvate ferredoxin oxidoreductase family protein n=1 Tax=Pseudonocardia sp. RS010 TaxID=3385979 RepID=UPI0039A05F43
MSTVASARDHQRPTRRVSLSDRYEKRDGLVYLSGLQALVRIPMEQHRLDSARGIDSRTLIAGYPGSPLAGLDLELSRQSSLLTEHGVVLRPSVNEELAATSVQGSQLSSVAGRSSCDGVVGIWYGKAPGLDRATDAIRHANLGGSAPTGGVLALVGDDVTAKSSTVPSSSEVAMAEMGMTVLSPCDPQDLLELGLHGIALSRFTGLWTGLKLATSVVDGAMTVDLDAALPNPVLPDNTVDGRPYVHEVSARFLPPVLGELERTAQGVRPELARRYAAANELNRVVGDPEATIGIVAHGPTYLAVREALLRLRVDVDRPGSGVRLLKLGMIAPLEPDIVRQFAAGLDEVVVVEEKRAFVELAIKDLLYGTSGAPDVYGKRGPGGAPLLRGFADLPPEEIARSLRGRLARHIPDFDAPPAPSASRGRRSLPLLAREPYFCSGCPHNTSTKVPSGSLVGLGIGCSTLAAFMDESVVGESLGLSQMGGEGAAWIGIAPFVEETHTFQNIGDGTFHHSGSLAIRAAVAAGVNITYKLLYNDAVAMTGGQQAVGHLSIREIVQMLLAEGVSRIVITTEDLRDYRRVRFPAGVQVRHRDRLIEVQEELATTAGVTVLIHDQECATELRRKRKRNKAPDPTTRVFINERVCEGCGDCGQKSNCLSVQPVETEYGRKTQIHQASCNKDYSCLDGDCPSFVEVQTAGRGAGQATRREPALVPAGSLPAPRPQVSSSGFSLRMTGIGGTGVVTTAQVLATAGVIDGYHVRGLDQLGMAQKGGAVVSDLLFASDQERRPNKVGAGDCDLYLGFDLLVASAEANLTVASPDKTFAVVSSSQVPTGAMVTHPEVMFPTAASTVDVIAHNVRDLAQVDARSLCTELFGDDQHANFLLVGAAVQAGVLPIDPASVEAAITLNGVAVERNVMAFRYGRLAIADPAGLEDSDGAGARAEPIHEVAHAIAADAVEPASGELYDLVVRRVDDLIAYQDSAYARRYASILGEVRLAEEAATVGHGEPLITLAVAQNLHKLMAYKDEYEVARLSLAPELSDAITREFGAEARWAIMLHPPVLRSMGLKRKLTFGPWSRPVLRILRSLRRLRGTVVDPFGMARVRRVERDLIDEYVVAVKAAVRALTQQTQQDVLELASLPDTIRGYEEIKLRNVDAYRERLRQLSDRISRRHEPGVVGA